MCSEGVSLCFYGVTGLQPGAVFSKEAPLSLDGAIVALNSTPGFLDGRH